MITYIEDGKREVIIHVANWGAYAIQQRCKSFLNTLCQHYGSSFEGRIQAACAFLHIHQKPPILIREGIILFPIVAADTKRPVWINYCMIKETRVFGYQTKFIFADGDQLLSDTEYRSVKMHLHRCTNYLYALHQCYTPLALAAA